MTMDRSLLDSTTVSDIITRSTKRRPSVDQQLQRYLAEHGTLTFSHISCYEILRGLHKSHAAAQLHRFRVFCQKSELLPVSFEVLDRAAQLWAKGQQRGITVDDGDLIIAATALEWDLALVTSNTRHFDWIDGLSLSDWRRA